MTNDEKRTYESEMVAYLKTRVSRAQLLKASAVGAAFAAFPGVAGAAGNTERAPYAEFPFFPQVSGRYQSESIQSIINTAVTAEHLAVTLLTAAVGNTTLNLGANPLGLAVVQAALMEELLHLQFLRDGLGATPLTTTFTVPSPTILTDQKTFFATLEAAENLFVAAYMAAVREFAELGQPLLAKYAYQIGGTEAEHRVLARAAQAILGVNSAIPPNNKAFETDLVVYVADAATVLTGLGFLGGSGTPAAYPGDTAALAATGAMAGAVIQRVPNNATSSIPSTAASLTAPRNEFSTLLSGANEPGGGDLAGTGRSIVSLNPDLNQVCYEITVSGIKLPAVAAHIHQGPAGTNGPIVVPLSAPGANGLAAGCVPADPILIQSILANPAGFYVNVHTSTFPGGAVRGQLG